MKWAGRALAFWNSGTFGGKVPTSWLISMSHDLKFREHLKSACDFLFFWVYWWARGWQADQLRVKCFGCHLTWDSSDVVVAWFAIQVIWMSNDLVVIWLEIPVLLVVNWFEIQVIWMSNNLVVNWCVFQKISVIPPNPHVSHPCCITSGRSHLLVDRSSAAPLGIVGS